MPEDEEVKAQSDAYYAEVIVRYEEGEFKSAKLLWSLLKDHLNERIMRPDDKATLLKEIEAYLTFWKDIDKLRNRTS